MSGESQRSPSLLEKPLRLGGAVSPRRAALVAGAVGAAVLPALGFINDRIITVDPILLGLAPVGIAAPLLLARAKGWFLASLIAGTVGNAALWAGTAYALTWARTRARWLMWAILIALLTYWALIIATAKTLVVDR